MQLSGYWLHHCWEHGCAAESVPPVGLGSNLARVLATARLFLKDVGSVNVQQIMLADGTLRLTSIRGMAHVSMCPGCETPGWQLVAGPRLEPRVDSSEACVTTLTDNTFLPAMDTAQDLTLRDHLFSLRL